MKTQSIFHATSIGLGKANMVVSRHSMKRKQTWWNPAAGSANSVSRFLQ